MHFSEKKDLTGDFLSLLRGPKSYLDLLSWFTGFRGHPPIGGGRGVGPPWKKSRDQAGSSSAELSG